MSETTTSPQTGSAIETHGLRKSYSEVHALRPLDLQVPKNSIVGFLGPNGAGKSTTIKLLLGLIQPTGGSATVFGLDIERESIEIRRRVGYLAQQPRFYPEMTARETLHFAARFFYTGPRNAIEERVEESLALVGLADKADRPVRGFSGGEIQRLGIAQAQINRPDLLILDEPAAALDPMGRRDVLAIMTRLRAQSTIFYSTHILDDVQRVSDRVVILNHGELISGGPIEVLLAGDGQMIYSLTFRGDEARTQARLAQLSWVTGIHTESVDGVAQWRITVEDEQAAEAQLLRQVLADEEVNVLSFGREQYQLEDVFLQLVEGEKPVEGENHGR
jgi:ABC-2 type transport system ATP-binding protein